MSYEELKEMYHNYDHTDMLNEIYEIKKELNEWKKQSEIAYKNFGITIDKFEKENEELKKENIRYVRINDKLGQKRIIQRDENEALQKLNEELTGHIEYLHGVQDEKELVVELNEELHARNEELKKEIKQLVAISMTPECAAIKLKDLSIE